MQSGAERQAAVEVLTVDDCSDGSIAELAARYGLEVQRVADDARIPGSFWGEPEAGLVGNRVYVRGDTPLHSFLHEFCHLVCMSAARRRGLVRDAGGDDAEECAVCYLQILLADSFENAGRARLMRDMDAWGYSFRLGSAARWFAEDATDAHGWLRRHGLVDAATNVTFRLRGH